MSNSNTTDITELVYTKAARNGAIAGAIGGAISGILAGIVVGIFICCCYETIMPKNRRGDTGLYTYRH